MNFEDILKLVEDTSKTKFQLAADIHALISKATAPSALNITPMKPRAKRGPNKAKAVDGRIGGVEPLTNGADHEAH